MKKFLFILLIISMFILPASAEWTSEDIKKSSDVSLSWDMMNKCSDIVSEGKGYLVVRADKDTEFRVTNPNDSLGAFPSSTLPVLQGQFVVFEYDKSFKLTDNSLTFDNCSIYDNNGILITSRQTSFHYPDFDINSYSYVATNVGLYNSSDECIYFSTSLPVAQGFYINFKKIIRTVLDGLIIILPVLVLCLALRKGWLFAKRQIKGA